MTSIYRIVFSVFFIFGSDVATVAQDTQPAPPPEIAPRECLVIEPVGKYGRTALHTDALEAQIVAGRWAAPKAGDTVQAPDGAAKTWETLAVGEDGWFQHKAFQGGYAYFAVNCDAARIMLLEASGNGMVYVNGEPRAGDPYQNGIMRLPVALKAGTNDFLFHCPRGRLRVKLVAPAKPILLDARDATLPDLVVGELVDMVAAVVVINATTERLDDLFMEVDPPGGRTTYTRLPAVPPLGVRKTGFLLKDEAPKEAGEAKLLLDLRRGRPGGGEKKLDAASVTLRIRQPAETRKITFLSEIDDSVQYYALNPARRPAVPAERTNEQTGERPAETKPALFFSLHGASVEAIGQADAYSAKSWGHIVAPTNRRPFGFDWEDWGRLDALEVLNLVQKELRTDPRRVYLTGHSMGGHGTWQLGAHYPGRFAAIGPSAGWISFASYGGAAREENPPPMREILQRAAAASDTPALLRNYAQEGIYILHGDADDNVPVAQARQMKEKLGGFHLDFAYHEQPGAGHWWDASDEPGADCVDWAPMFDFFARHMIPDDENVRQVDFTTVNPGVSAWCHWAGIEAQIQALKPSSISLRCDPGQRRFVGKTENVARLALRLTPLAPDKPFRIELDGQKIDNVAWPEGDPPGLVWLVREKDEWRGAPKPAAALKGPHRYGPFKEAFRNNMAFVYGTKGTPEENAWALAKARYDAETFWYRGNGSVDVLPDTAFDANRAPDHNVILYGNAETNAAWPKLLAHCPVDVRRGGVKIGDRKIAGDDLACLFLYPRAGRDRAAVGVVSGSGVAGMRLTERLPYFLSGVAYPDCVVIGPAMLADGVKGVKAAGFFGLDWGVAGGEFVWGE